RPAALSETRPGGYRWVICALLFFATTVNYIDRQILALIKEFLDAELGWSNETFGKVNGAFQLSYGLGLLVFGWVGGCVFPGRGGVGVSEGGNFPSAIKAVALWFPKRERAFATAIFNAGTNVGAIIAPAMIPAIALNMGWRWTFILAGIAGFVWLLFWIPMYDV